MFSLRVTSSRGLSRIPQSLLHIYTSRTMSTDSLAATQQSKSTPLSQSSGEQSATVTSHLSPLPAPTPTTSSGKDIDALARSIDRVTLTTSLSTLSSVEHYGTKSKPFRNYSRGRERNNPRATPKMATELRDQKTQPSTASGGIPDPTVAYLQASNVPYHKLHDPQHLLVVIDLNGTLLFRPNRKSPTKFVARPNTQRFLGYCIDTFTVVIWSSARPENVRNMCDAILSPDMRRKVAAIWGRDKFNLTREDYDSRTQCYKRLTKLWTDEQIARAHPAYQNGGRWDQTNTVLVDDSLEKGRSEPYNLIEIPEFFGDGNEQGHILPQVHDYLNYLAMHSNVSACLQDAPFRPQLQQMNKNAIQVK